MPRANNYYIILNLCFRLSKQIKYGVMFYFVSGFFVACCLRSGSVVLSKRSGVYFIPESLFLSSRYAKKNLKRNMVNYLYVGCWHISVLCYTIFYMHELHWYIFAIHWYVFHIVHSTVEQNYVNNFNIC